MIEERFGSLNVNPRELFNFLEQDAWVREFFQPPQLIEGELDSQARPDGKFNSQALGSKLVQAGVLELDDLERLLEDYRPFAATQRFGEFLRLNMQVPPAVLDLLINPELFDQQGFNEKRLGERLLEVGAIDSEQLEAALADQRIRGGRIGEILAAKGAISPTMARFFSEARVNARGEVEYTEA